MYERTIFALRVIAAVLMGLEFIFNKARIGAIDAKITAYTKSVQDRVDADIKACVSEALRQWAKLVVELAFCLGAVLITYLAPHLKGSVGYGVILLLAFAAMFLLAGGLPLLADILVKIVVPLVLAAPLRGLTWFLVKSPKGSSAAIGFVLLMASFVMQWFSIKG